MCHWAPGVWEGDEGDPSARIPANKVATARASAVSAVTPNALAGKPVRAVHCWYSMKNRVLFVPRRRACTLALSLAASSLAWAQPATLPATVVTATRIDTRSDELVSEVRVIERAAIEASTARTLPELLAREAGVQFSSNGGLGQFSSVFIRGTQARHTILLVDGVRLGSATAGTPVWETLPVEAIERIEVLKGPASALYGADGVGGVVQVFTRAPKPGFHPYASVAAGSYGHARAAAGASGGEGALSYSFGVQRSVERGFSSANTRAPFSSYQPDRDPFRQNSVNASLRYQLNRDWSADASLLYSDATGHFDDSQAVDSRSKLRASLTQAGFKGRVQPGWTTELRISESVDANHPIVAAYPDPFKTTQTQWTWQNTVDTRAGIVLAGFEQRTQRVTTPVAYDVTQRTIDAGFLGLTGQAGNHSWQANMRRDVNSQFGSSQTGFAGYGWRFAPNWRLHSSYGTTFVAPSFNDLYYPGGYGNPNLRPEYGRNRDLGLAWSAGGQTLKLIYFDNKIRNAIAYDTNYVPQNIGRARIDGWTLGYEARIDRLSLRASLEDMQPRNVEDGKALPRRSDTQATLGASWREGAWLFGTSVLHVGSRFDDTANTRALAAYTVIDLHATWQFAPRVSLQAKLNNLTDRAYETTYGYNQPGRAVYFTLRWQPK
jgi:vitamin B12 transporter